MEKKILETTENSLTHTSYWQSVYYFFPRWMLRMLAWTFAFSIFVAILLGMLGLIKEYRRPIVEFTIAKEGDSTQAIQTALAIWQNTVDNLGNDISTIEISLAISGVVVAGVIALGIYYIEQSVKDKTRKLESRIAELKEDVDKLDKKVNEIESETSKAEAITKGLVEGTKKIYDSINYTEIFSRNPYYNSALLNFYALVAFWRQSIDSNEQELSDLNKFFLGCFYYIQGNYGKATDYYNKISEVERGNNFHNINFYLGLAYDDQENYSNAILYYSKEIEFASNFRPLAYSNRGFTYIETEQFEQAFDDFSQSVRMAPEDPYPYYGTAICLYRLVKHGKNLHGKIIEPKQIESYLEKGKQKEKFAGLIKENYSRKQFKKMEKEIEEIERDYLI